MNKLLVLAICIAIASCSSPQPDGNTESVKYGDYRIKTIDSCEYIEYDRGINTFRVYSLTHKGNCKFCNERSKGE